jgi:hypothetical protein
MVYLFGESLRRKYSGETCSGIWCFALAVISMAVVCAYFLSFGAESTPLSSEIWLSKQTQLINPLISLDGSYTAVLHLKNGLTKTTKSSDAVPAVVPEVLRAR